MKNKVKLSEKLVQTRIPETDYKKLVLLANKERLTVAGYLRLMIKREIAKP
jgi:hypothetical protein